MVQTKTTEQRHQLTQFQSKKKTPEPTSLTPPTDLTTLPTDFPEKNGKSHVPGDTDPHPSPSDSSPKKSYFLNDRNSSKAIKIKAIRRKSARNTRNRTRQTHRQAIIICPTAVTTDASDVKIRVIGKIIR